MSRYDRIRSIGLTIFVATWAVTASVMATGIILIRVERHWVPWTMTLVSAIMILSFVLALIGRTTAHSYRPPRPRGGLYIPPPPRHQSEEMPAYRVVDMPPAPRILQRPHILIGQTLPEGSRRRLNGQENTQ